MILNPHITLHDWYIHRRQAIVVNVWEALGSCELFHGQLKCVLLPVHSFSQRVCVSTLGFESCIQQRNTTCLLSIRKSLACDRASKIAPTNLYIAKSSAKANRQWGRVG